MKPFIVAVILAGSVFFGAATAVIDLFDGVWVRAAMVVIGAVVYLAAVVYARWMMKGIETDSTTSLAIAIVGVGLLVWALGLADSFVNLWFRAAIVALGAGAFAVSSVYAQPTTKAPKGKSE